MTNPFFAPSTLPYQLPPFAEITDDHYAEAIEAGMAEQRREIDAITAQADEPTFANTIEPLERSGQLLGRVLRVFLNKSSADSNDATNALEERYAALLSAHEDAISLDAALFARIDALYTQRDSLDLSDDQRYLIERRRTEMFLAGAGLDDAAKARLSELNGRLSTLSTKFQNKLLADTNDLAVVVDDVAELDGLTSGEIAACAQAAADRGLDGKYLITLVLPTGHP